MQWLHPEVLGLFAFGAVFTLAGLALVGGSAWALLKIAHFYSDAQRCPGRVVSVESDGDTFCPVIEYYAGGGRRTFQPDIRSSRSPRVGDEVQVAFDPINPGDVRAAGHDGKWAAVALLIGGLPFLLVGLFVLRLGFHRPQERAKENKATAFIAAAGRGDVTAVRRMLNEDPNLVRGVELSPMMSRGSSDDSSGRVILNRPLHAAAKGGQVEMVELLLARGAEVDATTSNGDTALHQIGEDIHVVDDTYSPRRVAIANLLLARGANANARTSGRRTPLHTQADDADVVALLIEHGAEPRAVDAEGRTPLHSAASRVVDASKVVQLLIKHGADPNARDRHGNTPLNGSYHAATMEALIDAGARADNRNDAGKTALHENAHLPQGLTDGLEVLALLCACGVRPDLKDGEGHTPLDYARARLAEETDARWAKTRRAIVQFLSLHGTCERLSDRARESGRASKEEREAIVAEAACAQDDMHACGSLAWAYGAGEGVPVDHKRELDLYTKVCDRGSAWACGNLGIMYHQGEGVTKDETRAAALYQKACDGKSASHCINLGILYEEGRGVVKDLKRALALYRQACDAGQERGCREARSLQ
jgi:hypothetical protein